MEYIECWFLSMWAPPIRNTRLMMMKDNAYRQLSSNLEPWEWMKPTWKRKYRSWVLKIAALRKLKRRTRYWSDISDQCSKWDEVFQKRSTSYHRKCSVQTKTYTAGFTSCGGDSAMDKDVLLMITLLTLQFSYSDQYLRKYLFQNHTHVKQL